MKQKFNTLIWTGWKKVDKPFIVITSDMTSFWANKTYYELTLYFDAWNKEIIRYELSSRKGDTKTYYDGLKQVLNKKRIFKQPYHFAYRSRHSIFFITI